MNGDGLAASDDPVCDDFKRADQLEGVAFAAEDRDEGSDDDISPA